MISVVQILSIFFSAVLLPLALPNELFSTGLAVPGLFALVPALLAIYAAPSRRSASRLGALFGAVSTVIANYWLAFFGDFSIWTIGGTVIGYTGYNYILFGFLHFLVHGDQIGGVVGAPGVTRLRMASLTASSIAGHPYYRPIRIALAWTAYEYLKSVGFLGYPWGLIAYPIAEFGPVAQIAELTGPWGLSFLGAYINAALAGWIAASSASCPGFSGVPHQTVHKTVHNKMQYNTLGAYRHIGAATALFALAALFGVFRLPSVQPTDQIEMVLVQQNVNSWNPGQFTDALRRAQELTLQELLAQESSEGAVLPGGAARPEAIVWSETSLRVPYEPVKDYYFQEPPELPFRLFLQLTGIPLITGTPQRVPGTNDYTNSAIVILPDGSVTGSYDKQQLVPFAESIPFWNVPMVQTFFRDVVGLGGTWVAGSDSRTLTLPRKDSPPLQIGTPICFEDAFGWVTREMVLNGAQLLVNLTNNSWSLQNSAQTQHYAAARLRTIELRTTLVRGTNSGLSGVIDARGVLVSGMPMFESAGIGVTVPLYPEVWTLYRAWGDWLGVVSVVVVAGTVARAALRRRRRDSE
jgi:apolipoprotein N-acyltransferase